MWDSVCEGDRQTEIDGCRGKPTVEAGKRQERIRKDEGGKKVMQRGGVCARVKMR